MSKFAHPERDAASTLSSISATRWLAKRRSHRGLWFPFILSSNRRRSFLPCWFLTLVYKSTPPTSSLHPSIAGLFIHSSIPPFTHCNSFSGCWLKRTTAPNWRPPTWLLSRRNNGGALATLTVAFFFFFVVSVFSTPPPPSLPPLPCFSLFPLRLWSLYPGTNVAAFPNKWQLNEAPRVLRR